MFSNFHELAVDKVVTSFTVSTVAHHTNIIIDQISWRSRVHLHCRSVGIIVEAKKHHMLMSACSSKMTQVYMTKSVYSMEYTFYVQRMMATHTELSLWKTFFKISKRMRK